MKCGLASLIMLLALTIADYPSLADDASNKEYGDQRRDGEKSFLEYRGNPFMQIIDQLDNLNDKLDELLVNSPDLRGVTQNWDKKLDSTNSDVNGCNSDRFTCIWPTDEYPDGSAVRDEETGLMWERAPVLGGFVWTSAIAECRNRVVSGRKGWHLPTVEQLGTMVDASGGYPAFPTVHPFFNVDTPNPTNRYWSSTTDAANLNKAHRLLLGSGILESVDKGSGDRAWCVRGGQSFDGQELESLN